MRFLGPITVETESAEGVVWHSANDGVGSGLDADSVDGLHAIDIGNPSRVSAQIKVVGWYRIAVNGEPDYKRGGSRASACFYLNGAIPDGGDSLIVYASNIYGRSPILELVSRAVYGTSGVVFSGIRMLCGGVGEGSALEVYVSRLCNASVSIFGNLSDSGWVLQDWRGGSKPPGFTETSFDFSNVDIIKGMSMNNLSNYSYIRSNGDMFHRGRIFFGVPNSMPSADDLWNGSASWWLDEAANRLTVRVKYSNGTVRRGTINLST